MNPSEVVLSRAIARHGVSATLTIPGDTFESEADVSIQLKVLPRKYEATPDEKPTGIISDREKFAIPQSELTYKDITEIKEYYKLEVADRSYTVKKATPGYSFGKLVRWDVEVLGQQ